MTASCSHMRGGPCSQCVTAAPVRTVTVIAGVSHVDGVPSAANEPWRSSSAKRGGEATKRKHAPKPARRRR